MQTSIIRRGRFVLTPETAEAAGLVRSGIVRLLPDGDSLVVEPSQEGVRMDHLQVPVADPIMSALGWSSGDVVGLEPGPERLLARRLDDPLDPSLTLVGSDGAPVPPHWLIQTVAPAPRVQEFVDGGHRVARLFAQMIGRHLPDAQSPAVMDFGCGCGRVARALPQHIPCEISGADLTEAALEWCRRNLGGEYLLSGEHPPLALPDERFDVLYAVSVLTHLDESHQDAWLGEWQRLVRPGGLLLVTYRGEGFLSKAKDPQREKIESLWGDGGFGFTKTDFWEGIFPDFYGGAYHRDAYVREHWGRFFEVLELVPSTETALVQDLAVMRRR